MPLYEWLTFVEARKQLAQRLYDSNMVFTIDAEMGIYIQQALRQFNCLTYFWKTDFVYNNWMKWNLLENVDKSPRPRTLTDVDMYTQMQYMLLEPPTGATWTGTPQFDIFNFSKALQLRRDEIMQITNCNQQLMPNIALTPNNRRTILPDNVMDVARVRYLPLHRIPGWGYGQGGYGEGGYGGCHGSGYFGYGQGGYGEGGYGGSTGTNGPCGPQMENGITLYRDDTIAQEFYEADFWQAAAYVPQTFMVSSQPPLTWDVDIPPSVSGVYEAVVSLAGQPFNPPTPTLLNIPDDYTWCLIWGALADLLGRESEATDRQRADYCMKRYLDGLQMMLKLPWVMLAKYNGVAVNIESIVNADRYMPEWDSYPTSLPFLAIGGIDTFAAQLNASVGLTVLGNAPIPVADNDYVQVSRSMWDTVLDLAQTFATFKMGGAEWQSALEIEARAIKACAAENARLRSTGAFADILVQRAQAMDRDQERYSTAASDAQMATARQQG